MYRERVAFTGCPLFAFGHNAKYLLILDIYPCYKTDNV
jgi:hypothetical protein